MLLGFWFVIRLVLVRIWVSVWFGVKWLFIFWFCLFVVNCRLLVIRLLEICVKCVSMVLRGLVVMLYCCCCLVLVLVVWVLLFRKGRGVRFRVRFMVSVCRWLFV